MVLMHNYSNFLGKTYTKLIARADFAALITGNVPSKIDGYDEEFCIQTYKKGLEFQFSSADQRLNLIIASDPVYFAGSLKGVADKSLIRNVMGTPIDTMEEKKVPVLGVVGAWDKFSDTEYGHIQVLYEIGSDKVKSIFYKSSR
ncbi:hypothetical protein BTO00_10055 [Vibrio campbellii]|nr:hypothetical protein BTO00_10055 [Vibrio campbellii]